ncbi:hypothetical protein AAV99_01170 [Aurantiacibacter marinus]|uniref:Uncharacterized protein n=1 Tax=Aurantiacibacter marinus TaxID=874156 RepID=A0A0H0XPQ0_9SPHN|nr:hypothetical protein AAV99_01170 [Aurantiacibacter marinus]
MRRLPLVSLIVRLCRPARVQVQEGALTVMVNPLIGAHAGLVEMHMQREQISRVTNMTTIVVAGWGMICIDFF